MGQLVLIRHAKAADGPADAARPLSDRGRRDASALGAWLREAPDHVVVSPSRRTRETWELVAAALDNTPEPVADERVYDNRPELLLAVVREAPAGVRTIAVVGHNPRSPSSPPCWTTDAATRPPRARCILASRPAPSRSSTCRRRSPTSAPAARG